jgi:hypothetical protein
MIAHFFLWTYPKNVNLMKTRFKICKWDLEGKELWHWPRKIGALKGLKIVWSPDLDSHDTTQFCIRVFFSFGLSICFDNELSSSVCR